MEISKDQATAEILKAGQKLAEHFFVASNDGNISCRLNDREILITPSGVNKGEMSSEQLITVSPEGQVLAGTHTPSSELKMHLRVYTQRPDVRAVVHAHPPAATGFASCGIRMDEEVLLPEVVFGLGKIGFAAYGTPTTEEVPQAVAREIGDGEAMLLANHGALTVGPTVMQAYYRMEVLEMYARVRLVAKILGRPQALDERQLQDLHQIRADRGWGGSSSLSAVDPQLVQTIAGVVMEVLQAKNRV